MNLEDLISKYLDGELTQAEDDELRSLISLDRNARAKFDAAVNVHMAIKEDSSSIETPEDLLRDTEDKVLMKMLATQPDLTGTKSPARKMMYKEFAVAASFLFLISIFNISDMELFFPDLSEDTSTGNSETEKVQDNDTKVAVDNGAKGLINNNSKLSTVTDKPTSIASGSSFGTTDFAILDAQFDQLIKNEIYNVDLAGFVNDIPSRNSAERRLSRFDDAVIFKNSESIAYNALDEVSLNRTDNILINDPNSLISETMRQSQQDFQVKLASFFGSNILGDGSGNGNLAVSHFSQSLAYSVNEKDNFGVEFGYSEMNLKVTNYIVLPTAIGGVTGSDMPGDPGSPTIKIPIQENYDLRLFWGSAFYEREILSYDDLEINSRLGLGFSSEGPVAYLRFLGRYELFSGFALTLGAEGRVFESGIPYRVSPEANGFLSSYSVVYGFQFNF